MTDPAPPASSLPYRASLGVSLATAAVAVAFFLIGLADGTVSSFNIALWTLLLAGIGAVLWAGVALRARGRTALAVAVLCVTAAPAVIAVLFVVYLLVAQPRWN
jgi:hypothetical protein